MASPQETDIATEAHVAVMRALTHPGEFGAMRANAGDCFTGAVAAGADDEAAHAVAIAIHMDPVLRTKVASTGGLILGAMSYLETREDRG